MRKLLSFVLIFSILFLILGPMALFNKAYAGNSEFTQAYLRLNRIKASTTTGGTVCAQPAFADTEAFVEVTFPSGFTVDTTASNWTVTTTNLPSGATAWAGIDTATGAASQTVTFTSGDLTVGTLYCFNFSGTSTLTNPSAGDNQTGTIRTVNANMTPIDTANYAVSIISDDQIAVTATVSPIFTFALGGNSEALGTLSTSSVTSGSGITATIGTNASSGWITWVKNSGLTSSATSETIAAAGSVDDSPEDLSSTTGVVLDVDITTDSSTGDGTVTQAAGYGAEYAGADTNSGGSMDTNFQPVAASDGTTDGDVLTLIVRAKVSAVQAAATDYADTITVVAAGRF